jgi:hypothetical protein
MVRRRAPNQANIPLENQIVALHSPARAAIHAARAEGIPMRSRCLLKCALREFAAPGRARRLKAAAGLG